jgi:hypothetical protein
MPTDYSKTIFVEGKDTAIQLAGVLRCCVGTVAKELEGQQVKIGDKSKCKHCGQVFTLARHVEKRPTWISAKEWEAPIWVPDWQVRGPECKFSITP